MFPRRSFSAVVAGLATAGVVLAATGAAMATAPVRLAVPEPSRSYFYTYGVDGNYVDVERHRLSVRPKRLTFAFPEGATQFRALRWRHWGNTTAVARGRMRNCSDDAGCQRNWRRGRIRLEAKHTFKCSRGGGRVQLYTGIRVKLFPGDPTQYLILGHPEFRPNCS